MLKFKLVTEIQRDLEVHTLPDKIVYVRKCVKAIFEVYRGNVASGSGGGSCGKWRIAKLYVLIVETGAKYTGPTLLLSTSSKSCCAIELILPWFFSLGF